MKTFSDRLRDTRHLRGMTQQELGDASGVSQSGVASYESRQRKQSRKVMNLARALQVNAEWLETGKGPMEAVPDHYTLPVPGKQSRIMEGTAQAAALADRDGAWPFTSIARSEYAALTLDQRQSIELVVRTTMNTYQAAQAKPAPKKRLKNKPRRG